MNPLYTFYRPFLTIKIYSNRVEIVKGLALFQGVQTIFTRNIASVETKPLMQTLVIRTNGGSVYRFGVNYGVAAIKRAIEYRIGLY